MHHLLCDRLYQLHIFFLQSKVLLQILSQILECQIVLIVGLTPWRQVYLSESVDLQVLSERIDVGYIPGLSAQDDVAQLNAVLRQAVDQVEVEVAEELGIVILDHEDHAQGRFVEFGKRLRHGLPHNQVRLKEGEEVHYEVLEFQALLDVGGVVQEGLGLGWGVRGLLLRLGRVLGSRLFGLALGLGLGG